MGNTTFLKRLILGAVLVSVFAVGLAILWLDHSREQDFNDARTATQNLSKILEQYIVGTVRHIDLALLTVSDEFDRQIASGRVNEHALQGLLAQQQSHLLELESLRVTDAQGMVRYGLGVAPDANVNVSDRDYFISARDNPTATLIISKPMFARISKKWVIVFARRLNHSDGSFAGVVYINLALERLSKTFSGINVGPHGVVSLRDAQMTLIARHPEPQSVGIDAGSKLVSLELQELLKAGQIEGTYFTPTSSDNIARTVSFRKVGAYPLYVIVGLAHDDFLSEWRREVAGVSALVAVFLLVMSISSRLLFIAWRRRMESEWQLKAIIETEPECVKVLAPDGTLRQMNRAGLRMIEADSETQVIGGRIADLVAPEYRQAFRDLASRVNQGESGTLEFEVIGLKGGHRWLETHAVPMRNSENQIVGLLGVTRDISKSKQAEKALREKSQLLDRIVENIPNMVFLKRASDLRFELFNRAGEELIGHRRDEMLGRNDYDFFPKEQADFFIRKDREALEGSDILDIPEEVIETPNGVRILHTKKLPLKDEQGRPLYLLGISEDITERKAAEEKIINLAFNDALTQLPNRRLLYDRLNQAMAASKRGGYFCALLFLDLDNFKPLNDQYGHEVGDLLLVELANRLKNCMRETDTVGRFGGDEFVVLLGELNSSKDTSTRQAGTVAEKISASLSEPYRLILRHEGRADVTIEHRCTASIGVALFADHEASPDELLKWADSAMYKAKQAGCNLIRFYDAKD